MPRLHLGDWVDSIVDWLQTNLSWLFDFIATCSKGMYDGVNAVLTAPEPLLLAGILAVLAFWLRGLTAGVLSFAGFALIDSLELWEPAMNSFALVIVSTVIALVVGVPLGIWTARSQRASAAVRPLLDFTQTMPAMVYLIPAIFFFGLGVPAGIVATIIFGFAPAVRMTELGIRQVDDELVEAADAFGTTPRKTLLGVQLPLALPTIMAGVNQVIMLNLSMVVIAGMVGAGGLGGSVYQAIGNVDIGLGSEAGVSIVVLAIFLDRVVAALGQQISPLGRRAAARVRAMQGLKIWNYRPRPTVAVIGVVILGLVAGGMGVFGGSDDAKTADATDVGKGKTVNVGYIPWDEGVASTFLWKELLEQRGFKVDAKQYEAGSLYTGMANGQVDFQTDSWLPTTHAQYWKKYGDKLEDLGAWYGPTSLEIAVPSYVKGVKSTADLKGKESEFKNRIVGIEPSAGEMGLLKDKVVKDYGLSKYKVIDGSTPGMLAELDRAYKKKEPIAVTLWSPHWAYDKYDLTKLSDPKGSWGKGDEVHTLARKGFTKDFPEAAQWLKDFKLDEKQLSSLESEIQDAGKGKQQDAVKSWIKKNPGIVDKLAPVQKTDVNVGKGKTVNMGFIPWDEGIASSYLWKEILERRGFKVSAKQYEAGALYTGMANGQVDFETDSWLPHTHKQYWDKYGDKLEDMGGWYGPTSLEIAVPSYVKGVKSTADLKGKESEFKNRIVGIEPSAGEMGLLKDKVVKDYGLSKYKVIDGSTPGMLAELDRAYKKKEPIAVTLWSPHWAYDKYDLTKLSDPKGSWGKGDEVHTLARKGFTKDFPEAAQWLKDFKLDEKQLSSLESEIQDAGKGKQQDAVKSWIKKNPGIVDKLAPVQKTDVNVGKGKTVNMGFIPWDEGIASSYLWKEILERRGFKVSAKQYEAGALYTGMANGQVDFETDSWLPHTHKQYWDKYGDKLEDMGGWYGPTSLEIAVPSYVKGVKSTADLKGKESEFKNRIVGIEPSAGEMGLLKDKVVKDYGLSKYKVIDGSTPGMLAELDRAYKKKEPIAVTLWSPHWAYDKYDLTKLSDPKGSWGKGDKIHTLARKGFTKDFPEVAQWLKSFELSEKQLAGLEGAIQDAGKGKQQQAVQGWIEENPGIVDKLAPVKGGSSASAVDFKNDAGKDERDRAINVAWFPWEEDIAATYLWKHVLEERGYKMNLKQFEVGPMYAAMSRNQLDVQFDGWLPYTQKNYWDKYGSKLTKIGEWYSPTSLEIAVPSYVKDVSSLADLKGKGDTFGGRVIGIEPGTATMDILKNKVLPSYGLDKEYKVVDGSTPGMLSELKRAYAKKEPIAVMLWSPHWAYNQYDLTKLKDPKGSFGKGDRLTTVASKQFPKQYPQFTKWLKDFRMSDSQLSDLENELHKQGTGHEEKAVDNWVEKNPGIVDKMAPM
ncbi:ABC transporter permease/substrate binding protein [Streptomyces sp. NRRL F-5630]|uniref:ABC transporter permease/substrate binding protein n=2 Tax=Streptomyces sp. NRRL F-5630 TaxID=1463864 RepID=UPI003EC0EAAA